MLKSETSLWRWLEPARKDFGAAKLHMDRVENSAGSGMPDVEGCLLCKQFWIELKIAGRPKRGGNVDVKHLRPKQVEWLHNRWLVGGCAWILVRVESKDTGSDKRYYLIAGEHSMEMRAGMDEARMVELSVIASDATRREIVRRACKR